MQVSPAATADTAAQNRPTAARSPRRLALGTRLTIYVTLSVAAVITAITFVGTLIAQRQLDNDLHETAEVTAFAVADDIELRPEPMASEPLLPVLRSFMNAAPDLRSITVFRAVDGRAETLVSTSVVAPAPPALVQDVIARGDTVTAQPTPDTLFVAVPVRPGGMVTGAVAVAVSLGAVRAAAAHRRPDRIRRRCLCCHRDCGADQSARAAPDADAAHRDPSRDGACPWRRPRCQGVRHAGQRDERRRRGPE